MDRKLAHRITLVAAALALAVAAPVAFADKGGNGKGKGSTNAGGNPASTLSLQMVVDQNGDGLPNWNDRVTFDVYTDATDKPWVLLNCYQSGTWVSTMSHGFFPTYLGPNFTLASGAWTGGAGDCVATLYTVTSNGNSKDLATLSFDVGA